MGRRSTRPNALPHLRPRKKGGKIWYYYDHGLQPDGSRPETPLGCDYSIAVRKWAELEHSDAPVITVRDLLQEWQKVAFHRLAPKTIKEYTAAIARLVSFFGRPYPAPLADVESGHVGEYLAQHGNTVLATRDKAVLSAAWNWGRQTGVTALPNPCTGVRGKRSKDTHYVTDADLQAVTACGDVVLREALELLYLSGANPKDMLSWRAGIPEHLEFRRAKTQLPVRIRVEGELLQLLERIAERKRREQRISPYLLVTERGERLTYAMLYDRFDKARKAAGVRFNLRQIRAKAGTDKAESEGLEAAQAQLGHASITTTEIYVRNRRGKPTGPTR